MATKSAAFSAASASITPPSALRLVGDEADRAALEAGERGDHVRRPARRELEQGAVVEDRAGDVADVVDLALLGRDDEAGVAAVGADRGDRSAAARRSTAAAGRAGGGSSRSRRRRRRRRRWQTPLRPCTRGPPRSSMLIVFAQRLLHDLGAGEEHPRVGGHHDEVGQRRRVGAAAGGDAADDRDLRHLARELDAGAEDAAVAGQRRVALLQAGAAGADEADHRGAGVAGHPQQADDRLGVDFAERAAEEARVLGVAEDRPAADLAGAGDDAVARASPARRAAARRRRCAAAGSCRGRRAPPAARAASARPAGS